MRRRQTIGAASSRIAQSFPKPFGLRTVPYALGMPQTGGRERMASGLREQLRSIVASGLSADPLEHAGQVARIAGVLHQAFGEAGLRSTIVGGSAIELHAPGVYLSGDIDVVVERLKNETSQLEAVFKSLGFERRGRHWRIGDLFVEVPSRTLDDPSEFMRVDDVVFEIVKKEVVLADRIVGFRQWEVLAWGQQAIDLLAAFAAEVDEAWLRGKLEREGSLDALEPLRTLAAGDEPVSEGTLRELLAGLRGTTPR